MGPAEGALCSDCSEKNLPLKERLELNPHKAIAARPRHCSPRHPGPSLAGLSTVYRERPHVARAGYVCRSGVQLNVPATSSLVTFAVLHCFTSFPEFLSGTFHRPGIGTKMLILNVDKNLCWSLLTAVFSSNGEQLCKVSHSCGGLFHSLCGSYPRKTTTTHRIQNSMITICENIS